MFADDTTLTNPLCTFSSDVRDTETSINIELEKINKWLAINGLLLNVDKSKYMIFHYPQRKLNSNEIPKLKMNGEKIKRVLGSTFLV